MNLQTTTTDARLTENRNRAAEQLERLRRLNRDRIIQAALDSFIAEATDKSVAADYPSYLIGAANIHTSHVDPYDVRGYVLGLIRDIRAELSPVVTAERN